MQRLAAAALFVGLLFTSLATASTSTPASAAVCGSATLSGTGTTGDPFQVANAAQLEAIGTGACTLSSAYRQTADITLTGAWTPIGDAATPFTGSYDGNSRTISGMAITGASDVGMFGVMNDATISGLTLTGTVSATGTNIGMLAGIASNSAITSVTITTTVSATFSGDAFVGGMVGFADGVTVSGSSVHGSVSAPTGNRVGGMIGWLGGGSQLTDSQNHASVAGSDVVGGVLGDTYAAMVEVHLENLRNHGDVAGASYAVGGIAGRHWEGSPTLNGLVNTGDVTGTGTDVGGLIGEADELVVQLRYGSNSGTVTGQTHVGGFIGDFGGYQLTIETSTNSGNVVGGGDRTGGFVGHYGASSDPLTFIDCSNSGDVSSPGDEAGGFVGELSGDDLVITDSVNSGNVSGDGYVGGFGGYVYYYTYITNSTNSGTVRATDVYVGGLVGRPSDNSYLVGATNTGDVHGAGSVGGLIGYISDRLEVTDSRNTGSISGATTRIGGLVGYLYDDATIERSQSTGSVTGESQVGGLIGYIRGTGDRVTISASFARGQVDASVSAAGGLVGLSLSTDFNVINSYSAGAVAATVSQAGGLAGNAAAIHVRSSYSSAAVTAASTAGPLVGQASSPNVSASFWNAAASGLSASAVGTSASLTELDTFASAGWHIVDGWAPYVASTAVWGLCSNVNAGRPFLLWEYTTDPCVPSSPETLPILVPLAPDGPVTLGGESVADEAAGAVAVSQLLDSAPVVFLVARDAPGDAVVAAAYGGGAGGPVLVTDADQVPASTLAEIERLGATRVVVVGGEERVSNQVLTSLRSELTGVSVERVAGGDRIATAIEATGQRFPTGTGTVYLAATDAPADALVAAVQAAPVLYLQRTSVPEATLAELTRLSPTRIVIVGGPVRVAQDVIEQLAAAFPTAQVVRSGGADRYETAALFTGASQTQVMLVDGRLDRVDSVAAAATAALSNSSLLLTGRTCAPRATHRLLTGRRVLMVGQLGTEACR